VKLEGNTCVKKQDGEKWDNLFQINTAIQTWLLLSQPENLRAGERRERERATLCAKALGFFLFIWQGKQLLNKAYLSCSRCGGLSQWRRRQHITR